MKCFENYFEKNNYKISNICMRIISRRIHTKYQIYGLHTWGVWNVSYKRDMFSGDNIWQWDTTNENNNHLKWYNTNKIVIHENNVDTFIFFGWPSTLIELARLVVMFPIRFGCVSFKYYLQLISQRQNFLHLSNTLANESAPRNPWILHTPEHVIQQPGGDSAAARRLGGGALLATARISRYTAVFDRYCCDSPYGETAAVLRTHLSNGIAFLVTGGRPQWPCRIACPNRKCDIIVFNARYCVQRTLVTKLRP